MKNDVSDIARAAAGKVSQNRLWTRLMDLAAIGARPDGGVCRHALSPEDIEARALLISWAQQDLEAAQNIVTLSAGTAALAPPTHSVRELAALLGLASVVVAADTGALHLGAQLGIPVVGLYGPKETGRYGPWQRHGDARELPVVRPLRQRLPGGKLR